MVIKKNHMRTTVRNTSPGATSLEYTLSLLESLAGGKQPTEGRAESFISARQDLI